MLVAVGAVGCFADDTKSTHNINDRFFIRVNDCNWLQLKGSIELERDLNRLARERNILAQHELGARVEPDDV